MRLPLPRGTRCTRPVRGWLPCGRERIDGKPRRERRRIVVRVAALVRLRHRNGRLAVDENAGEPRRDGRNVSDRSLIADVKKTRRSGPTDAIASARCSSRRRSAAYPAAVAQPAARASESSGGAPSVTCTIVIAPAQLDKCAPHPIVSSSGCATTSTTRSLPRAHPPGDRPRSRGRGVVVASTLLAHEPRRVRALRQLVVGQRTCDALARPRPRARRAPRPSPRLLRARRAVLRPPSRSRSSQSPHAGLVSTSRGARYASRRIGTSRRGRGNGHLLLSRTGARPQHWSSSRPRPVRAFYDLDTPVTLSGYARGERRRVPSGRRPWRLRSGAQLHGRARARRAGTPTRCAARPPPLRLGRSRGPPCGIARRYVRAPTSRTSAPTRRIAQAALDELLLQPARGRPDLRFLIGGAQYPRVVRRGPRTCTVAPRRATRSRGLLQLLAVHAERDAARHGAMGWCPSGRLFEAAACGVPVICDAWEGLDSFFTPGRGDPGRRHAR